MNSEDLNTNQTPSSSEPGSTGPGVSYVERFEKERLEWTEELKNISARFKKIEDLVDVQVDLYSKRQLGVEYIYQLVTLHSRLKRSWVTEYKKEYDMLILNQDFRYSEKERMRMAEEKTYSSKLKLDILQSHIDFFRETLKTMDSMIFGIKHRMEIEDFRRGNK